MRVLLYDMAVMTLQNIGDITNVFLQLLISFYLFVDFVSAIDVILKFDGKSHTKFVLP